MLFGGGSTGPPPYFSGAYFPMTKLSLHGARRGLRTLFSLLALTAAAEPALALNVQPVVVDLQTTGRQASAIITLQNTFPDTVPVEVTVHPVNVVDGELREAQEEETDDVLVFPGQATIPGNQSQAFRVQWVGDQKDGESKHFYVTIAQLPVAMPNGPNSIQVLHRFKVLVSVGAAGDAPVLTVVKATIATGASGKPQPVLTVGNTGTTYGYVASTRMTIIEKRVDGSEAFRKTFDPEEIRQNMGLGLVPAKAQRTLPVNVDLPEATGTVTVELAPSGSK